MADKYLTIPKLSTRQLYRFYTSATVGSRWQCWPWTGDKWKSGYGCMDINGTAYRASRIAYFLDRGEQPGDLLVCHTCDNPICVNPHHLWLGTISDNSRDMVAKGRFVKKAKNPNGGSRLTPDQVRAIRSSSAHKTELMKEFNLSEKSIMNIWKRRTWASIE